MNRIQFKERKGRAKKTGADGQEAMEEDEEVEARPEHPGKNIRAFACVDYPNVVDVAHYHLQKLFNHFKVSVVALWGLGWSVRFRNRGGGGGGRGI